MIPYTVPELAPGAPLTILRHALARSVQRGDAIRQLERRWAEYVGVKYAVTFPSARSALAALYRHVGCTTVALPSYTCIPAVDAARWAGAKPHFLDVDLNAYNPVFEPALKKKPPAAFSLSYLYGLVGTVEPFLELAGQEHIPVIEDAAIALGATLGKRKAGAVGDAGVFSLQESKSITAGRGGIVTTNNKELAEALLAERHPRPLTPKVVFTAGFSSLRRSCSGSLYGVTMYRLKKLMTSKRLVPLLGSVMGFNPMEAITGESPAAEPVEPAFTNLQAALALQSLERIEQIVKKRRAMAVRLQEELPARFIFPREDAGRRHAWGRFPVRLPGVDKFTLQAAFLREGVETAPNYPYLCPMTTHFSGFREQDYPNALVATRETLLLPFHTRLDDGDIGHIVGAAKKIARKGAI